MDTIKNWFQNFSKYLAGTLLLIWPLQVIHNILDQQVTSQIQDVLASGKSLSMLALWVPASLAVGLSFGSIIALVILSCEIESLKTGKQRFSFAGQHLSYLVKEFLRGYGNSIAWAFLLILPGLFRSISYMYLPIVVGLNTQYQAGRIDALPFSRRIMRGKLGTTLGIFSVFVVIIPIALSGFDSYRNFAAYPLQACFFSLLEVILTAAFLNSLCYTYSAFVKTESPAISAQAQS